MGFQKRPPPPFTTFCKFPELPAEIRAIIWKHACPGPCIVEIDFESKFSPNWYAPLESNNVNNYFLPSGLLLACKESKEVHAKGWKPICPAAPTRVKDRKQKYYRNGSICEVLVKNVGDWPMLCSNPKIDTLYCGPQSRQIFWDESAVTAFNRFTLLHRVRFLAVCFEIYDFMQIVPAPEKFAPDQMLSRLPNLEEYAICLGDLGTLAQHDHWTVHDFNTRPREEIGFVDPNDLQDRQRPMVIEVLSGVRDVRNVYPGMLNTSQPQQPKWAVKVVMRGGDIGATWDLWEENAETTSGWR